VAGGPCFASAACHSLLYLLWAGIPLVVAREPWPAALARDLATSRATVWPTVPALLPGLLSTGFSGTPDLRLVISAGAPLTAALARRFRQQTGRAVHAFYGSSECGGIAFDREGRAAEIEGWIGAPMANVRLEFSPHGVAHVSGPTVSSGTMPEPGADELRRGQFTLPDILEVSNGGWRLLGRRDDVLNIGGRKVHPSAVEATLRLHPAIGEAVVFGTPHPGTGDRVTALLVAEVEPLAEADFRAWCEVHLPPEQIPRAWRWATELPTNERGKLSRAQLRTRWAAEKPQGA